MPKTKTMKSTKRQKDPKAPKRYRTAYILFSNSKRDQVKKDNPGLAAREILSELAAQWKTADEQTKQHFQKLSSAEKVEYEEKFNAYKTGKTNNKENSTQNKSISEEVNQSMEVNSSQ